MEVNFSCPSCQQELTADESMIGYEIDCPACKESIVIEAGDPSEYVQEEQPRAERPKLAIPSGASGDLIKKPSAKRLEIAAEEEIGLKCKTVLFSACGKDAAKFDAEVSKVLSEISKAHVISTHTVHAGPEDFGIVIVHDKAS